MDLDLDLDLDLDQAVVVSGTGARIFALYYFSKDLRSRAYLLRERKNQYPRGAVP